MDISELNREVYKSDQVVAYYKQKQELYAPEKAIFQLLQDQLSHWRMLDMGVGAGRTTHYFGPRVKEYWGMDYAPVMIAACQQLFPQYHFWVADAKAMPEIENEYFDLVLFSFNGLDCCGQEDRLQILTEIRRILKQKGYFCFSSHNLQGVSDLFSWRFSWNPFLFWRRWRHCLRLRRLNAAFLNQSQATDYAIINDGSHDYQSWHYYIRPQAQIRQLIAYGFGNIRLFAVDGRELTSPEAVAAETGYMIYYLCQKS